jgi:Uma2 family endonuclease
MSTVFPAKPKEGSEPIPPLENGDHLTREEFERRYEAMPHLKKAELIKGVVHMPSPLRYRCHGQQSSHLIWWLMEYAVWTRGVDAGDNCTVKVDFENEPQPDALLMILPEYGGQCRIDQDGFIIGSPELTGEVAASSVSYDLHEKLDVYRQNGVREYIVWRVLDKAIDWFVLVGDKYETLPLSPEGWYRSQVFPGLWLDPQALLTGDLARVAEVVRHGLADAAHQRFVEELAKRRQ